MAYRFAKESKDYTDYSSGRVFYGLPGHPAFPVRLVNEIFQRCLAIRESWGMSAPCVLYDPCCGGAYHLSVLVHLFWQHINTIIGSDIDEQALALAARNLSLLTPDGIKRRIRELSAMADAYGKKSHQAAIKSAETLQNRLLALSDTHHVKTTLFCANAADGKQLFTHLKGITIDIIITDLPYGSLANWQGIEPSNLATLSPVQQMLEALLSVVSSNTIVAIVSDKRQKIVHEQYQRIERFRLGKRQIVFLKPLR
jgi:hypothetical protein